MGETVCPAEARMFASINNVNNTTNNNCMLPMDNEQRCPTTHEPTHHILIVYQAHTPHTRTHEPRARGALAMAHGVPYISSTSGSNMAALLHCCTPGSPTSKGGSEQ